MTSPPLPEVSLRSGFAFCVTPQATAQDQPNRQRLHLAEPKRCLYEGGHLSQPIPGHQPLPALSRVGRPRLGSRGAKGAGPSRVVALAYLLWTAMCVFL